MYRMAVLAMLCSDTHLDVGKWVPTMITMYEWRQEHVLSRDPRCVMLAIVHDLAEAQGTLDLYCILNPLCIPILCCIFTYCSRRYRSWRGLFKARKASPRSGMSCDIDRSKIKCINFNLASHTQLRTRHVARYPSSAAHRSAVEGKSSPISFCGIINIVDASS